MDRFGGFPLLFALLIGIVLMSVSGVSATTYPEAVLHGYTFTFDGKTYDSVRNESTWHYTITGPMVSGSTYKELSHWILALCTPHQVLDASGHKWERRSNPDPHHGLIGIKWDEKVDKQESASFYFVLHGDWDVDMNVAVAMKAGQNRESGVLPGPACQPPTTTSCQIDYSMTTELDWKIMKPGVYTQKASRIQVSGNSPVRLEFRDFQDAQYTSSAGGTAPVTLRYSLGETLAEAESFGWHEAVAFNDMDVVVPQSAVAAGAEVNVWVRAIVTEVNRSSNYEGGGRIAIVPLCE